MESRYSNGYVQERKASADRSKRGWRAFLRYRDFTGKYKTPDGEIFDTLEEAHEHAGEGVEVAPDFKWRTISKTLPDTVPMFDMNGNKAIDPATGEQKQKKVGKREAEKLLAEWQAELDAQDAEAAKPIDHGETVAQYLDKYIEGKKVTIARRTASDYRKYAQNRINPELGDIPLDDLTPDDVRAWLTHQCDKYAVSTVRSCFFFLKGAMDQAVDTGRLENSPMRTVKPPKQKKAEYFPLDKRSREILLPWLAGTLDTDNPPVVNVAIELALYTGMREGEICALRWNNVHLDEKRLRVGSSQAKDPSARGADSWYIKEPKSDDGYRTIYIPDEVCDTLARRKSAMQLECLAAGVPFRESMFVVGRIDDVPMRNDYLSKNWHTLAVSMGLTTTKECEPKMVPRFHDLRHTYGTLAIAQGIDPKSVANSMGHSDVSITLNCYAAPDEDAGRAAAQTMANLYAGDAERGARRGRIVPMSPTGTEG